MSLLLDRLVDNDRLVLGHVVELGGESVAWLPAGRLAGRDLGHTHIGLLERQALELGDEEICKCDAKAAETTPKEEHLRTKGSLVIADKVWCDDG